MSKPSDIEEMWRAQREKIIGLGERSLRKTYYPELQQKLDELERFRALLDQSNDFIFLIQAATLSVIDVNDSACRQLGGSREEVLSQPLANSLPEEALARITALVSSGQGEGTITTELHGRSGATLPVEITMRLVTFNKTLYGVAVARDLTERKRVEKALIEHSRMLHDMELARQIQLSLLPLVPPQLPGVVLAGSCIPATHVGGDYYDFYRREGDVLDLVIADVSGHNIGAALMAAEVRSVLHAEVHSFCNTGEILSALNEILFEDLSQAGLCITLAYLKFDAPTRTLTYSNAGHPPALLSRSSRTPCQELDAEGLILGVKKEVFFEEKRIQLQSGDLVLLYTDGITEAENDAGELFGSARLCDILRAMHAFRPGEIIDAVRLKVAQFTGSNTMVDDVTMVVMKVL